MLSNWSLTRLMPRAQAASAYYPQYLSGSQAYTDDETEVFDSEFAHMRGYIEF